MENTIIENEVVEDVVVEEEIIGEDVPEDYTDPQLEEMLSKMEFIPYDESVQGTETEVEDVETELKYSLMEESPVMAKALGNNRVFIKNAGGNWNLRTSPVNTHTPKAIIEPGQLFMSAWSDVNYPSGTRIYHNSGIYYYDQNGHRTLYTPIEGYFRANTSTSAHSGYSALYSASKYITYINGAWYNHANDSSYLYNCSKLFINHIHDSLRSLGWNGSSNYVNGNFCYRNGFYGTKVRTEGSVVRDGSGNVYTTLSRGHWVFFTWAKPPINGLSYKTHVRIAGYTKSTSYTGTLTSGTFFFDADLDHLVAGSHGAIGYNLYTYYNK